MRILALLGLTLALRACCGTADPPDGWDGVIYGNDGGDARETDAGGSPGRDAATMPH